jgi:hypothetical protein
MPKYMILFLLTTLSLNGYAVGGQDVGSGGDTVDCMPGAEYSGLYNLDYLANLIAGSEFSREFAKTVPPKGDPLVQIERVIQATARVSPTFSRALQAYQSSLFKNSLSASYTWKSAPYGLVEIDDENLRMNLPWNCIVNGREKPFIQTVIRTEMPQQVQFTYYSNIFNKLDATQKSFLLFHEWLWGFTQNPEVVRNANAVLHSDLWDEAHADEKLGLLHLAGFDFKALGQTVGAIEIKISNEDLITCSGSGSCLREVRSGFIVSQNPDTDLIILSFENQNIGKDAYYMAATSIQSAATATFRKIGNNGERASTLVERRTKKHLSYCVIFAEQGAAAPVPDFSGLEPYPKDSEMCPNGTQLFLYSSR